MKKTWTARELQKKFKYKEWRNFNNLIQRARNLILNGLARGDIKETLLIRRTGFGAKRKIQDYVIDESSYKLIEKLAAGFKLHKVYEMRNETSILFLVKRYCDYRNLPCYPQFFLDKKIYDLRCGNILIEFDEPHHKTMRQKRMDFIKNRLAENKGFHIIRICLDEDIIDVIRKIDLICKHEVNGQRFGRMRSRGDQALFGGRTTLQMKKKMGIPENRPLADFLPTITIKAKDLAAEITNFNVKKNDLKGENPITNEHVKNNRDVRDLLAKIGIKPESLPAEEDIKKLERRVKADGKKMITNVKKKTP